MAQREGLNRRSGGSGGESESRRSRSNRFTFLAALIWKITFIKLGGIPVLAQCQEEKKASFFQSEVQVLQKLSRGINSNDTYAEYWGRTDRLVDVANIRVDINDCDVRRLIQFRHGNGESVRALVARLTLYWGQKMSQIEGLTGGPEDLEKQLGARTPGRGGTRHEERAEWAEEQGLCHCTSRACAGARQGRGQWGAVLGRRSPERAGLYVNDGVMKAKPGGPHCDGVHLVCLTGGARGEGGQGFPGFQENVPGTLILDRREAPIKSIPRREYSRKNAWTWKKPMCREREINADSRKQLPVLVKLLSVR
ncbi:hypothetical protein C8F04DRAFT_1193135 [Mycena alexandri]|uniref:Uncharacterized protein n=1 Tax=Mycena alexandri TaxID=1745969 RepID=A0AAD6WSM6_9AGAR|nr:hypothetical protein C8F04DRAFT_1193135 [Mycena alexandri]